jgi:hypothetical protein
MRTIAAPAVIYLVAVALFSSIQLATPHLIDRDGYFHARYANLFPARGFDRTFEWAQESALCDRFSDKEILFHALLAPFCADEARLVAGAKVATIALGGAIVLAFYLVLRAQRIRGAAAFALLLFSAGNHFLFRLSMARPHLLSVLFAIAGVHAILSDRRALAVGIGFFFSWSYAAPHLLVGLAAADAVARRVREGKWRFGPLAATSAGVGAGLFFHPYFPNDLRVFWIQSVLVLKHAWGLAGEAGPRLGAEFDPVTTRSLLFRSTGALAALGFAVAAGLFGRERPSARTLSIGAMTGGALFLFLFSAKFVEYFAPLAILFAASAATDLAGGRPLCDLARGPRRTALAALAMGLAALLGARAVAEARRGAAATPPPALEGAARYLRATLPPGEIVLHLSWADFSTLFFFDPGHRYLVSFDPIFAWVRDPERARLLEDVRAGRRPLDPAELRRTFGGRRLVVSKERRGGYEAAHAAGLDPVYEDWGGAVFSLE